MPKWKIQGWRVLTPFSILAILDDYREGKRKGTAPDFQEKTTEWAQHLTH